MVDLGHVLQTRPFSILKTDGEGPKVWVFWTYKCSVTWRYQISKSLDIFGQKYLGYMVAKRALYYFRKEDKKLHTIQSEKIGLSSPMAILIFTLSSTFQTCPTSPISHADDLKM